MNFLSNINPNEFTISAFIVGYLLTDNFNAIEQNAIGSWLILTGHVLEANAAQLQVLQQNNSNNNKCDIENIKRAINIINEKLNNIK